ncbi:metallophosphoesterase family protein [Rhodovarius lipocyclicus]|uniref:metallophosphoesterase family protein n=1 Tax=Rhodovarius lipocyclicus TaxID=268410 RepID=UPI00135BBE13|nr:metallophosphoesterase [Rhodovarius lipocyclicus]
MSIRIAQISDAHLSPSRPYFARNFAAVQQAVREAKPDLVLATGDLSLDGADSDEDLAHAVAAHAEIGIDWLCVPGNHDVGDEAVLGGRQPVDATRLDRWRRLAGPSAWVRDVPGWRLIGFDTQSLSVNAAQWEVIEQGIRDAGARRIALVQHKPLAEHSLTDTAVNYWPVLPELRARLLGLFGANLPALVMSGHVHQWRDRQADGIRQVWAPSTGFVVGDGFQPTLGNKLVGWVEHILHADGTHEASVRPAAGLRLHDIAAMPEVYGHHKAVAE